MSTNTNQEEKMEVSEELEQGSETTLVSPKKEYLNEEIRQNRKTALVASFLIVELIISAAMIYLIASEDLFYRVVRQIENDLTGKNVFQTGEYLGDTDFGYFTGDGVFNYRSGSVYQGQWSENFMCGIGELKVPDEGVYEGEFSGSEKNGKGVFTWDDGTVYNGEWESDKMSGRGTYVGSNGVSYEGIFRSNSFRQGQCVYSNKTGNYSAVFEEGLIEEYNIELFDGTKYSGTSSGVRLYGSGVMQFANGDSYSGDFKYGLREGLGTYVWSNGDKYEGTWDEDVMSGNGEYVYADGSIAKGQFNDNKFISGTYETKNASGTYMFDVSGGKVEHVVIKLTSGTELSGEIENGELTGSVEIVYHNGDTYQGNVINAKKSGEGKYTWSSGAYYEGEWKDDLMEGQGTYYYPQNESGYKLLGTFKLGVPDGECQYYIDYSESYKTDWVEGKCVKIYE